MMPRLVSTAAALAVGLAVGIVFGLHLAPMGALAATPCESHYVSSKTHVAPRPTRVGRTRVGQRRSAPARRVTRPVQGYVHVCKSEHFDPARTRCVQEDRSIALPLLYRAQLVWPNYLGRDAAGHPGYAARITVLKLYGTSHWVAVGSGVISTAFGTVKGPVSETLWRAIVDANYSASCQDQLRIQVSDRAGGSFGLAPVTLTCGQPTKFGVQGASSSVSGTRQALLSRMVYS